MNSREIFFARLEKAESILSSSPSIPSPTPPSGTLLGRLADSDFRLQRFKKIMLSQKTEIYDYPANPVEQIRLWKRLLVGEGLHKIAYSSQSFFHPALEQAVVELRQDIDYASRSHVLYSDRETDYLVDKKSKSTFLDYDVGITEVESGLADTGSLLLIPSPGEPRALSLVPPVHIAVLPRENILPNLSEWIRLNPDTLYTLGRDTSSNLILISGPSKTADIEKRLVHGVHGPRRLIVLLS